VGAGPACPGAGPAFLGAGVGPALVLRLLVMVLLG
jgi:hypothetical protein